MSGRDQQIRETVSTQLAREQLARRAGDAVGLGVFLGSAMSNRSLHTRIGSALFLRKRVRFALEDAKAKKERRKGVRSTFRLTVASIGLLVILDLLRRRREAPAEPPAVP